MKYLERAYPWLLVAPSVLPVIILNGLLYPYLVPKTLLFYALSLVSCAAFLILVAYGRAFYFARLRAWPAWVPGALLALAYLASAVGVDFYRSFWSLYVRGDGLLMLTCAVGLFYLVLLSADRMFFNRLVRLVAIVGAVVAVYGIGEWLFEGQGRVGSLLGNAGFFAGYLGIAFFATLLSARSLAGAWRRVAYAAAALEILAIVLTATRGSILALGVACGVVLAYVAWQRSGRARMLSVAALVGVVLAAALFFAFRADIARVPFAPITRLASIGVHDPDVASRLFIWQNMLGQVASHPLLGTGAEHIDAAFNSFYDPTKIQEEWFDRSHNAFLDYAVQYGVGGLLLYLALIGSFLLAARRLHMRGEGALAALFALLAVVYAAQNFFIFDTISSFWLILALLACALALSEPDAPARALLLPRAFGYGAFGAALVCILLVYPVSIRPAEAAYDISYAYKYALTDPGGAVARLRSGFALGTYGDLEYGYEAYAAYIAVQGKLSGDALGALYQETESILERNFNRYPYDARTALYFAHVLALPPSSVPMDKNLLAGAIARAIKESPKRYQSWYLLVNLSIGEANAHPAGSAERTAGYEAAIDLLRKYTELVPGLSEPHFVIAELSYSLGDTATAASEAALGTQYYRSDLPTARRAARYYEVEKDWADARFFLQEVVSIDASDTTSLYDLAKVSYLDGDPAAADAIFTTLRARDPGLVQSDPSFVAAITAYEQSKK